MKKIETIWNYILNSALIDHQYQFTQQLLAKHFQISLSTVNLALDVPTAMGAIRKSSKFFILQDFYKLLLYWGSIRQISKDIIYSKLCKRF